ncbi:hypothetical protein SKAU_G00052780 [Synaphobranchus kaupii]|uniref:Uncharacterized protein n=1 Tax=Synaphobranchus kaupii TaxID=118154 RepID=A0A9Q1G475_SYNKA|nr:hypothetical protein SKAU_G00052780 [Synaphobranchus kaupii]
MEWGKHCFVFVLIFGLLLQAFLGRSSVPLGLLALARLLPSASGGLPALALSVGAIQMEACLGWMEVGSHPDIVVENQAAWALLWPWPEQPFESSIARGGLQRATMEGKEKMVQGRRFSLREAQGSEPSWSTDLT